MNFYTDFLNEDWSDRPSCPRSFLGVFGKHPGWNDHFDIGLETESLLLAKKIIYEHGIRAEIEAQTWDRLADSEKLPEFDHWFLWLRPRECIVGHMGSSRDGKGRCLYPMVVCAHLVDVPLSWAWQVALPAIATTVQTLRAASTAGRVVTTVSEVSDQLRNAHPNHQQRAATGFVATAGLADLGDFLRSNTDKLRMIYDELVAGFSSFAPGVVSYQHEPRTVRSQSLRLPSIGKTAAQTLNAWAGFLMSELDPGMPLLAIKPNQADWTDCCVGLPVDGDLFRIRAGSAPVPVITNDGGQAPNNLPAWVVEEKRVELASYDLPVASIFNKRTGLQNLTDALARLEAVRGRGKGMFWRLFGATKPRPFPVFAGD